MAGGAQIIISADGISIKTPRAFHVFAGQHQFLAGEAVMQSHTALPNPVGDYSNRFDYGSISNASYLKHNIQAYVIEKTTGKLLAHDHLADPQQLSGKRFYTSKAQAVIGMLALSDEISATQAPHSSMQQSADPLLAELVAVEDRELPDQVPEAE